MSASHTSYEIQDKHSGAVVCFAAFIKLAPLSYILIIYYVAKDYWVCVDFFNEKVTKYVPWRHEKIARLLGESMEPIMQHSIIAVQVTFLYSFLVSFQLPSAILYWIEKVPFAKG